MSEEQKVTLLAAVLQALIANGYMPETPARSADRPYQRLADIAVDIVDEVEDSMSAMKPPKMLRRPRT